MIHYHGCPITPRDAAIQVLSRRHACVSHAYPQQIELVAEVCQSFMLDNGAFSQWKQGFGEINVELFAEFVGRWHRHPGYDWCLIPDVIDGGEDDNDRMIVEWVSFGIHGGVPVWHMHESIDRLVRLCKLYPRVALGSSGEYASVGTVEWWGRMAGAMDAICDTEGRPITKLHGLRMLNPVVFSHLPLASADSCNVARNIGIDDAWRGTYVPASKAERALILAGRIESHASATRWNRKACAATENLQLLG